MLRSLGHIARLVDEMSNLSRELDMTVSRAREAGASWIAIGAALGCSSQAAHKRYRWLHRNEAGTVWREPPLPM